MSETIHDGGPAFPFVEPPTPCNVATGMTLRDYFAKGAMEQFINTASRNPEISVSRHYVEFAEEAFRMADAMLAARGKGRAE